MGSVYTYSVREFRAKVKEALDRCKEGGVVSVHRGEEVYTISMADRLKECTQEGKTCTPGSKSVHREVATGIQGLDIAVYGE